MSDDEILALLEDDDRLAREAQHADAIHPGVWETEHHNSEYHEQPNCAHICEDRHGHYWTVASEVFIPVAEHIARQSPANVLSRSRLIRQLLEARRVGLAGSRNEGER